MFAKKIAVGGLDWIGRVSRGSHESTDAHAQPLDTSSKLARRCVGSFVVRDKLISTTDARVTAQVIFI